MSIRCWDSVISMALVPCVLVRPVVVVVPEEEAGAATAAMVVCVRSGWEKRNRHKMCSKLFKIGVLDGRNPDQ